MSKTLDEIKDAFDKYKDRWDFSDLPPCKKNPFGADHWMLDYLFPEVLIISEDYVSECFQRARPLLPKGYTFGEYFQGWGGLKIFPCWIMPESEVLRIMAEHGIL